VCDRCPPASEAERLATLEVVASGLAHEIRNPLNGAQLHLAVVERAVRSKPGMEEVLDSVGVVGEELRRLARLVTDFLDFAQPRAPQLSGIELGELCERVAARERPSASGVDLRTERLEPELTLDGDAARLEHMIANLIQNAVEAARGGGRRVVVRTGRAAPTGAFVEVEDDGPGVPPGSDRLFEPFFSTKRTGTGLGLAIVQRIAVDHRGTVAIDSSPGRTCFRVTLPERQRTSP
jgi:signal transduction histidine kinase